MTFLYEKRKFFSGYSIFENGELVEERLHPTPEELKKPLRELTETYEEIRNLGRFDPNNCPIMEFQTYNGKT